MINIQYQMFNTQTNTMSYFYLFESKCSVYEGPEQMYQGEEKVWRLSEG